MTQLVSSTHQTDSPSVSQNNESILSTPPGPDALVIKKDLVESFYKDEGGKANHLCAIVGLPTVSDESIFDNGGLKVTVSLHYDNGAIVEDADTFFTVLSFEPNILTSTASQVELKFRLEKVSRRKDGRRFKVRFQIDQSNHPCKVNIKDAFTSNVTVYSKRKMLSRNSIDSNSGPPKARKNSIGSARGSWNNRSSGILKTKKENTQFGNTQPGSLQYEQMANRLMTTEKKMKELFELVQHQHERIRSIERVLKETRSNGTQAQRVQQLSQQYFSPDHMLSLEDCVVVPSDPLVPLNPKRVATTSEVQFNFGRSSSPLPQLFEFYE